MKLVLKTLAVLLYAVLTVHAAAARESANLDRTLSPYFMVRSDNPNLDQLPLKKTSARVNIAGVIADVLVTQVYRNEGKDTLEAIYVFPASTRAAVYGMKMTLGSRTITAEIREREKARKEYEAAKKEGKTASLLEQERPNVFQMNVANILPGDEIVVELSYTELLVPTKGVYEFVYPTVVGPRYSTKPVQGAADQDKFLQTPYLKEGEMSPYKFDINTYISAGLPLQSVTCDTHKVKVEYEGLTAAQVKLDPLEEKGGNRDYVLRYRLAGGKIESGLLLFKGETENFFLLMVQPPERVQVEQIPPRDYVFIMDVSGSMMGFPISVSKQLLRDLIMNLRPTDTFNVLLFSGGSAVMSDEPIPAIPENLQRAVNLIDNQRGGGGTELLPALKRALALPRPEGVSRTVVIATDGYVAVEKESFDIIRNHLNDMNVFAFGIGTGVNRHIIEGMARVGMGEPFVVKKEKEAASTAKQFREYIQSPVLTAIRADFGTFEAYEVEPASVPDVLAERPVIIFGKWKGPQKGVITLQGLAGKNKYTASFNAGETSASVRNSALKYLWARHRIALLDDYNMVDKNDERVKEVTQLGLRYNLLTAYTSFIAVDNQVRRDPDGKLVTVKQALPLPEGVPNTAIGFEVPGLGGVVNVKVGGAIGVAAMGPVFGKPVTQTPEIKPIILGLLVSDSPELPAEILKKLIEDKLGGMKEYVETLKRENPGTKGKIVIKMVIDSTGRVVSVKIEKNELNKTIGESLRAQMKKWTFTGISVNKSVTVDVPLTISL